MKEGKLIPEYNSIAAWVEVYAAIPMISWPV